MNEWIIMEMDSEEELTKKIQGEGKKSWPPLDERAVSRIYERLELH